MDKSQHSETNLDDQEKPKSQNKSVSDSSNMMELESWLDNLEQFQNSHARTIKEQ